MAGADIDTATGAGSVVEADARRGIQRGRKGFGDCCEWEKARMLALASSPLSLVPPAPLWYSLLRLRWRALSVSPRRQCFIFSVVVNNNKVLEINYSDCSALVRGHPLQYHTRLHSTVLPNHPQPHYHIRERIGCIRNMTVAASCLNLNQTVPRTED